MLGNSKAYTNMWESHEVKITWPEQPRLMNGNSIVFYEMPVFGLSYVCNYVKVQ